MGAAAIVSTGPAQAPARTPIATATWQPPVPGALVRPFSAGPGVFDAGSHRGVDLAARRGQRVVAACSGRVAFAGTVGGSGVVTLACGSWRVTHLPVDGPRAGEGAWVSRGEGIGRVGSSRGHAGLHLGVRRAGRRFGYVDPWSLISPVGADAPRALPGGRAGERRPAPRRARGPRVRPAPMPVVRAPGAVAAHRAAPVAAESGGARQPPAGGHDAMEGARHPFAPPVSWLGLAILLAGAMRARRRRARRMRLRVEESPAPAR